jgi:hypothetical protein
MSLRLLVAAWISFGLAAAPLGSALAQPALEYHAPEGCPAADEVARSLEARVEPLPGGVDDRIVAMEVGHDPAAAEPYRLTISLQGPGVGGTRQLAGLDCAALVDAGVIVVALALGPRPDLLTASQEPPGQVEPPPASVTPPAPPPAQAPTAVEEVLPPPALGTARRVHLGGWLASRLAVGSLPTAAGGVALGLALRVARLRAELAFEWLPRSVKQLDDERGSGGEFALFAAEARFCGDVFLLRRRALAIGLCGGVEIGAITAEGVNVDHPTTAAVVWVAPEAGGQLRWAFTRSRRIALRVDAAAEAPIVRSTFYIQRVGDIHRPAPVVGRFGLGLSIDFF